MNKKIRFKKLHKNILSEKNFIFENVPKKKKNSYKKMYLQKK